MMDGWIVAFHQLGASVAAYAGGLIYQVFNSYIWAFTLAGGFWYSRAFSLSY